MSRENNHRHGGAEQLCFFDGLLAVFGLAADFKVSFALRSSQTALRIAGLSSTTSTDRTGTRTSTTYWPDADVRCRTTDGC